MAEWKQQLAALRVTVFNSGYRCWWFLYALAGAVRVKWWLPGGAGESLRWKLITVRIIFDKYPQLADPASHSRCRRRYFFLNLGVSPWIRWGVMPADAQFFGSYRARFESNLTSLINREMTLPLAMKYVWGVWLEAFVLPPLHLVLTFFIDDDIL